MGGFFYLQCLEFYLFLRNFLRKLTDEVTKSRQDNERRLGEVRQTIDQMKKNLAAEKQIQFNEAIKKVSSEKDRQIDELKAKQADLMSRMQEMEKELAANRAVTADTTVMTSTLISSSSVCPDSTTTTSTAPCYDDTSEDSGGGASGQLVKSKLREVMLKDKVRELEKQLSMLNTLPVTNNFYETVQLNSCNVDDLVLAVFSEEHNSYRVVYK